MTLLVANYAWKWTVSGDSPVFEFMVRHVASAVYWLVSLFRDTVSMPDEHTIRFASGAGTTITWGCSGLKQSFIWLCLILTVLPITNRQLWLHKLWYIPVGWVVCYVVNILRIAAIALLIEHHPEWFHVLHDYLFKYLFYAILFGMWVIFVEKIKPLALSR